MIRKTSRGKVTLSGLGAMLCLSSTALAGGELSVPPAAAAGAEVPTGVALAPVGVAGGIYQEYLTYGAHVRRSYMPGFIPQTESLWENPRTWPSAVCVLAQPYRYANIKGWFFGSPNGYQSSVPPGSIAHKYVTGQLGITTSLQYGYPRGMRVIEPVIVPFAAHSEEAGLFITSDGIGMQPVAPAMPGGYTETEVVDQAEKLGPPDDLTPSVGRSPRAPLVPEFSDK